MKIENTKEHISFFESENSGPLLLLIHGFPNNASMWQEQIAYFQDQYHILAINLPGTWDGSSRELHEFDINLIAQKINKILENKNTHKKDIFIVGHDLGAFIAHAVAAQCRQTISGIVFISGMPSSMFHRRLTSLSQLIKSAYVVAFNFSIIRKIAKNQLSVLLLRLVYKLSYVPKDSFLWSSSENGFQSIDLYRQMTKHVFKQNQMEPNQYNSLFIFGSKERFLNIPTISEIEKDQSHFELEILPGGHWLPATHSEKVNQTLSRFFNKAASV